jgi:hypothetical protein
MKFSLLALTGALAIALPATALPGPSAQSSFLEVEPNNSKEAANLATGLVPGDEILLEPSFFGFDPDIFRVQPAALSPGIYRHTLRDQGSAGPTRFRALGLDGVIGEVLPDSTAVLSDSLDGDPVNTTVAWYGFGKSEELYTELYATGFTRSGIAARVVFETEEVVPTDIGSIEPWEGLYQVRVNGTGAEGDTEVFVFDSEYNLIPFGWNDDAGSFNGAAIADVTLTPGRYYVAVSTKGLSSHTPPGTQDIFSAEFAVPSGVTDFKGPLVAGNFAGSTTALLTIRGDFSSTPLNAPLTVPSSQSAAWATFTVGTTQETFSFCPGDGSLGPCPCGNESAVGARVGCLHSEGLGASIISNRLPFDSVRLNLESLPRNAASLVFVSMGTQAPVASVGGLSCLAAPAARLEVVFADAHGYGEVIEDLVATGVFLAGTTVFAQAAYRDPGAAAGCQVNLTSGVAFRL